MLPTNSPSNKCHTGSSLTQLVQTALSISLRGSFISLLISRYLQIVKVMFSMRPQMVSAIHAPTTVCVCVCFTIHPSNLLSTRWFSVSYPPFSHCEAALSWYSLSLFDSSSSSSSPLHCAHALIPTQCLPQTQGCGPALNLHWHTVIQSFGSTSAAQIITRCTRIDPVFVTYL